MASFTVDTRTGRIVNQSTGALVGGEGTDTTMDDLIRDAYHANRATGGVREPNEITTAMREARDDARSAGALALLGKKRLADYK